MDFAGIPLFSLMKAKLNYLSERQSVLAQNISNADTPDYKAKDLNPADFSGMLSAAQKLRGDRSTSSVSGNVALATTNEKHIHASVSAMGSGQVVTRNSTYELNPSGNNVSIEEEISKFAENQAEYNKVLGLYRKTVDMFKTAIGKTNG